MTSMKAATPRPRPSQSTTVEPKPCWSCKGPVNPTSIFCETCGVVQPPGGLDHYARLSLEPGFDIDESALEQGYFAMQCQLHPDRFATKSAQERALSMQQATSLNEAYETLKDPLRRADYLCHLMGAGVFTEGCDLVTDTELLMESMEMREALADAETLEDVNACMKRAKKDIAACIDDLSDAFKNDDIERATHLATRLKYLQKLAEEARNHRAKIKRMGL